MNWQKEFHGAREFGFRSDTHYVGKTVGKWWRPYVKTADGYRLLTDKGFPTAEAAQRFCDPADEAGGIKYRGPAFH